MRTCVFVGPTLRPQDLPDDIVALPPVAQGDVYRIAQRRPQGGQKPLLASGEIDYLEARSQEAGSELEPGDLLVQVLARPLDEARVDGLAEVDEALGHPS